MELSDIQPEQEYEQLMQIMDKKDWTALKANLHRPEVLEVLLVFADAVTQRKQAQIQLTESYRVRRDCIPKPEKILSVERSTLSECIYRNSMIEQEQLRRLTQLLYDKEYTYNDLHRLGHLKYFFE